MTTLDDCIWLVPFVAIPAPNTRVATIHAVVFVTTLTLLAILLSLVTFILIVIGTKRRIAAGEIEQDLEEEEGGDTSSTSGGMEDMELFLGSIGAGLCWILAVYLLYKRWKKRKRRRQAQQQDFQQQEESSSLLPAVVKDYGTTTTTKKNTPKETPETMEEGDAATENDDGDSSSRPRTPNGDILDTFGISR